jgi:hypothetical protein
MTRNMGMTAKELNNAEYGADVIRLPADPMIIN